MMNERQEVFNSSFIIPNSSFPLLLLLRDLDRSLGRLDLFGLLGGRRRGRGRRAALVAGREAVVARDALALRLDPEERYVGDARHFRERLRLVVVEQARERERLAVAQLDARLRAARLERGDEEAVELHAVGEVYRRDLGLKLKAYVVLVDDGRLEVEADALLLAHDRHGRLVAA